MAVVEPATQAQIDQAYLSSVDARGPLERALNAAIAAAAREPVTFFANYFRAAAEGQFPAPNGRPMTKAQVDRYLEQSNVQVPLEDALNAAIDEQAKDPLSFYTDYFVGQGPVDISLITRVQKNRIGLHRQPKSPLYRTGLVNVYVRNARFGGSDKSNSGCRYDTVPFVNGMIRAGISCQIIHYLHEEHDRFVEVAGRFDALIIRCNPGQIKADGGSQQKFDDAIRALQNKGIQAWPSPDVMAIMGAKDALCRIAHLSIGLEDTLAYYDAVSFVEGIKKTMAFQPRVLKQNRGSSGEGIWVCKLKEGNYCSRFGERLCAGDEVISMVEANDNHEEEHTIAEIIEFFLHGRSRTAGTWTSRGVGRYLEGGKAAGGLLVDQRFCPRVVEGELRYNCIGPEVVGIIHKKPKPGGLSAVSGTGSVYTFYDPDEPQFAALSHNFLVRDMPALMPALGLASEPVPLWWTTDFILASPVGTPTNQEKWIVGEFNCSCVGVSKCLAAYCTDDRPDASWDDIPPEDQAVAMEFAERIGVNALKMLVNPPSPLP